VSEFEFYMDVLKTLEEIGARYMVVGAYGASAYGLNRSTHDVGIIVATVSSPSISSADQ
jgi:hypothetical protein